MAEAYYAAIAPHNPLGPISLAAGIQLAASIPNFLCQEQVTLGEGYLKQPFVVAERLRRPARPARAWASSWTRSRSPTRSATTGEPRDLRRGRRLGGGLVTSISFRYRATRPGCNAVL